MQNPCNLMDCRGISYANIELERLVQIDEQLTMVSINFTFNMTTENPFNSTSILVILLRICIVSKTDV
jgi:hypothetical protein